MAKLSLKSLIARARASAPQPQADVEGSRTAAEIELTNAEAALAAAETAYRAGLIDADDDALRQLAQAQADAGLRRDRARALVDRFDAQLAEIRAAEERAQEAERQAELERIVQEANTTLTALREAVEERILPVMISGGHELLSLARVAERARTAAIHALQAAGDDRVPPAVEGFRVIAGRPEKTLTVETVELWTDEWGEPVGHQDEIVISSDASGWLKLPGATYGRRFLHQRAFERTEYLPALPAQHAVSLASALPEIVTALARLEMPVATPEAERRTQVRLRPIGDVVDVRAEAAAARRAAQEQREAVG